MVEDMKVAVEIIAKRMGRIRTSKDIVDRQNREWNKNSCGGREDSLIEMLWTKGEENEEKK